MNKDLTVGKPETVLWQFCLPLFGSIIFQQLYNIADSLVAGKFVGENAAGSGGKQLRNYPDFYCLWPLAAISAVLSSSPSFSARRITAP